MRINQFLARCGIASRRKVEELIIDGRVEINGQTITDFGTRVREKDEVKVDGEVVNLPKLKYYLLNKPKGYTVTKEDPHAKKTIFELLPKDDSLFAVGRLDRETSGLLIVTNDGDFGQALIHPSQKIQKEYEVILNREASEKDLTKLERGIQLEDGQAKAVSALKKEGKVYLIIEEGRKRQVRRMFSAIGYEVKELKRIRIGTIILDVKEGEWRELTEEEIKSVRL